jgi:hypothetical protein
MYGLEWSGDSEVHIKNIMLRELPEGGLIDFSPSDTQIIEKKPPKKKRKREVWRIGAPARPLDFTKSFLVTHCPQLIPNLSNNRVIIG